MMATTPLFVEIIVIGVGAFTAARINPDGDRKRPLAAD